jgi:hypothetical protein
MELQARFHGVGVRAFEWRGYICSGGTSATPEVRTLAKQYGQRPGQFGTHDRRDVDDHIDDGGAGQARGRRS